MVQRPSKNNSGADQGKIGFLAVTAIGIGGMVGGGIFAVLGLAVVLAGGGTPIAFALAGIVAALTCYSYVKLSVRFPSEGGTVTFLNQAFGTGRVTGSLNVLLWLSYLVTLSLYAFACGSYGATFFPSDQHELWKHVILSAVIVVFTLINMAGATFVGRAEKYIVGVKLTILVFVGVVGMFFVKWAYLAPSRWGGLKSLAVGQGSSLANGISLLAGGMIIFAMVNLANFLLFRKTEGKRWISLLGFAVCLIAVGALIWQTARMSPGNLWVLVIMVGASVLIEVIYRAFTGRRIKLI